MRYVAGSVASLVVGAVAAAVVLAGVLILVETALTALDDAQA